MNDTFFSVQYLCLEEWHRPLLPLPGGLVDLEDALQQGGRASVVTVTVGQAGRLAGRGMV